MSNDQAPLFYAYRYNVHHAATIHWASCPHCRWGKGQDKRKTGDYWTELPNLSEEGAMVLVRTDADNYRFCGYCCHDLRDQARRRA